MQFAVGFVIAWILKEPIKLVVEQVSKVIKDSFEESKDPISEEPRDEGPSPD